VGKSVINPASDDKMTNANVETYILRIESLDGYPQGTGFVITPTLAVTCVHVVEACGGGH
jgi:hypothetical protein